MSSTYTGNVINSPVAFTSQPAQAYPDDIRGTLVEFDTPAPTVDNIFYFNSPTTNKYLYRIADGAYRAAWAGIAPENSASVNGSRLTALLAETSIKEIVFDFPVESEIELTGSFTVSAGTILRFAGGNSIIGDATITGGVIDASYHQLIFGPDITITPESTTRQYMSAKWFGALGNASTDDTDALQKAIDTCIRSNSNTLFIPHGRYRIYTGLIVARIESGAYQQVSLSIVGEKQAYVLQGKESVIECMHNDNFALCFELAKGCSVENLQITGLNVLNYNFDQVANPETSFVTAGCRPNRYSPYAGIVLDAFSSSTATVNRYPPPDTTRGVLESYYTQRTNNSGSTDCRFYNITINGFVVNICLSPNGFTQNNDSHVFEHLWLQSCQVAFACCQSQTRQIQVRNLKCWNSVHTIFDTTSYGQGNGSQAYVQDVDIAGGVYQLFIHNSGWSAQFFKNVYAELLYRLGDAVDSQLPTIFTDCYFDLGIPPPEVGYPDSIMQTDYAAFEGGALRYYGVSGWVPFNFNIGSSRRISFRNITLHQPAASGGINDLGMDIFDYDNVAFYGIGGNVPPGKTLPSTETLLFNGGNPGLYNRYVSNNVNIPVLKSGVSFQCGFFQRRTVNNIWQPSFASTFGLTVNPVYDDEVNELTFDMPTYVPDAFIVYYVGMPVTVREFGVVGRVKSISGRTVVLENCINFTGHTTSLVIAFTPRRTVSYSYVGNATNGSDTITGVVSDGDSAPDSMLLNVHVYGDGFYYGTYVKSISGNTITLSRPFGGTTGRVCFAGYDYEELGESLGLPTANTEWTALKPAIRKGTVIRVLGVEGVVAVRCNRCGILGGSSITPSFQPVFDNSPFTRTGDFTMTIPAGTFISNIIVNPAANLAAFKVGTAATLGDVVASQAVLDANGDTVIAVNRYFSAAATLHFEGITSSVDVVVQKQ